MQQRPDQPSLPTHPPLCVPVSALPNSSLFLKKKKIFLFDIVYIVDRDAHACGPLIRVGRFRYGGRWMEHILLFFFSPVSIEEEMRGLLLAVKLHQHIST